jgi:SPP1 family predicted phage head-tail adaptor
VQAGLLRRRVTLQKPVQSRDTQGGSIRSWVDCGVSIPAAIEPLSGREAFAAAQIQSDIDCKITIRWRPGVTALLRVLHVIAIGSPDEVEIFNIEAVIPDPTGRRWIELTCKRRDADGFQSDG